LPAQQIKAHKTRIKISINKDQIKKNILITFSINRDMKLITVLKLISIFVVVMLFFLIPARAAENKLVMETKTMPREGIFSTIGQFILTVLNMITTIISFIAIIPILGWILGPLLLIVFLLLFGWWYLIGYALVFADLIIFKLPHLILMIFHFMMRIPHYVMGSFHVMLHSPNIFINDIKVFFEGLKDLPGIFLQL
jgi:hypothetical protein